MEKKQLNTPKSIVACFLLIMLLSCASKQNVPVSNTSQINASPNIIFLNYAIKKASDGSKTIRFINKKVVEGKLKSYYSKPSESGSSGDLQLYQLDKKLRILQSTIIANPLAKTIEYPNDSGSFQSKKIDLDSTRFSARLQLKPNTKYISIHNFDDSKNKTKPLILTELNQS